MSNDLILRPGSEIAEFEPWLTEPVKFDFIFRSLRCAMRRVSQDDAWLGYVAVPPGHPLHGAEDEALYGLYVHGGITYTSAHPPINTPPDTVPQGMYWIGFDCAHYGDRFMMGEVKKLEKAGLLDVASVFKEGVYRDQHYARKETCRLAAQIANYDRLLTREPKGEA